MKSGNSSRSQIGMRLPVAAAIGVVALVLIALLAIALGAISIPVVDVARAVFGDGDQTIVAIVRELRAPRVALAALVGAGLSCSGAALQGTLRNQLAEPYLLGVSGGAAVGAVLMMSVGLASATQVTIAAFIGAAGATALVTLLARYVGGRADGSMLLMAGVVVGSFANASILVALADAPPDRVRGALWWMMGSVSGATWGAVARMTAALILLGGALVWMARELDILSLGEEPAAALGADVDRATRRVFLVASWLAAATVAAAGLIGFVGLIVPNLVRLLGVHRHRPLLLMSALYGAVLLVAADLAARTVRAPAELPLGAVTALIGVPFFLTRLRRLR